MWRVSETSGSLTRARYAASGGECDPKRFNPEDIMRAMAGRAEPLFPTGLAPEPGRAVPLFPGS